jgi:hypothetical protein
MMVGTSSSSDAFDDGVVYTSVRLEGARDVSGAKDHQLL